MNDLTFEKLASFTTELRNEASSSIDSKSALEIVTIINAEDKKVPLAVEKILPQIAALSEDIAAAFRKGGRLFYAGAGTSGRLGVLDASECPPTYGAPPEMVQGLIAGGEPALTRSVEAAEDRRDEGVAELKARGFSKDDVLVGLSASGQAPYVLGVLEYAQSLGAVTGAISCNENSDAFNFAKHKLPVVAGPEVVTGSTRMKSGTAQKLVLNMLSTTSMILIGKVYKNYMVDLRPTNHKLVLRALRLIREITGASEDEAKAAFENSGKKPKTAIVMLLLKKDRAEAERLLSEKNGRIGLLV